MEITVPAPPKNPITRDEALRLIDDARELLEPSMQEGRDARDCPANRAHNALGPLAGCIYDGYPLEDVKAAAAALSLPYRYRDLRDYAQFVCNAISEQA